MSFLMNAYRYVVDSTRLSFTVVGSPSFDPTMAGTETPTWYYDGNVTNAKTLSYAFGDTSDYLVELEMLDFSLLTLLRMESDGIKGTFDASKLVSCTDLRLTSNSAMTSITNPTSSANFAIYYVDSCNLTGTLDLSGLTGLGGRMYANSNSNLTSITNPTSSQSFTYYWAQNCDLTGTLDLSGLTGLAGDFRVFSNASMTSITNPTTSGVFTQYRAYSCDLGYIDFTNFSGDSSGVYIDLASNSMTATEVNHILVDLDNTGWTGGTIRIHGSNAAPDGTSGGYDGTTAKSNLITNGWTATTN